MSNLTISIDDNLLNTSLNALIRKLLQETVVPDNQSWLEECYKLMDSSKANSHGDKWCRGDLSQLD